MEAYSDSLEQSLQEVRRIRTLEESVMSSRVAAAQEAFAKDLGELKRQYKMQVGVGQGRGRARRVSM